jgi:hypothetical protein
MELLVVLLLIVPIAWLWLLPGRVAKRARKHRFAGIGALLLAIAIGWIGLFVTARPDNAPVDYAQGDNELRAILGQPETAPRYSFRD